MCVILVADKGERPTTEQIVAAAAANPHGIGMAWIEGGEVRWSKDVPLSGALRAAKELPLPFVMHFRIASAGGVKPELCHPFPIEAMPRTDMEGTAKQVLFHNGHVPGWESWFAESFPKGRPAGSWSDSRLMARKAWFGFDPEKLKGQRTARLAASGKVRTTGEGWIEAGGVRWSNGYWLEYMADWQEEEGIVEEEQLAGTGDGWQEEEGRQLSLLSQGGR
jgi:hypothetical protein